MISTFCYHNIGIVTLNNTSSLSLYIYIYLYIERERKRNALFSVTILILWQQNVLIILMYYFK